MKDEARKRMGFKSQQARLESTTVGGGGVRRRQASRPQVRAFLRWLSGTTIQSLLFLALSTYACLDPFLCYKILKIFLNALLYLY